MSSSPAAGPAPAARHYLETLAEMAIRPLAEAGDTPIAVDAMVGYGLDGPLRGAAAAVARWARNRSVVSLDFPSGHGHPGAVEADASLTLTLPKEAHRAIGSLYVADLGLRRALWSRMGLVVPSLSSPPASWPCEIRSTNSRSHPPAIGLSHSEESTTP